MLMVRLLLAFYTVFLVPAAAQPAVPQPQPQKYEGMMVRDIQFDPAIAQQPLSASELNDIVPLKVNQPLHLADVRASIERLFATGAYADIQVTTAYFERGALL